MNVNTVALSGNLTRDPELRDAGESKVCDLGVAVNERVKRGDEWVEEPSFFDVTVWNKQAENCAQYLTKGSPVAIQGRLKQDRWQNNEGENRSKVKVVASIVQFGAKSEQSGSGESSEPADDDRVPF